MFTFCLNDFEKADEMLDFEDVAYVKSDFINCFLQMQEIFKAD